MADIAWEDGKGFYLQGDLNAWLGSELISGDPPVLNKNNFFLFIIS